MHKNPKIECESHRYCEEPQRRIPFHIPIPEIANAKS